MEYNKEVLERQYPVVMAFIQELAYFRGLQQGLATITDPSQFWFCTLNNHLKQATVDWCKVFGSSKEDIHWNKTPTGTTTDKACQHFRRRVLSTTGLTQDVWEEYRTKLLALRDKYVAHLDLKKPLEAPVPEFNAALHVAYAYRKWIKDVFKPPIEIFHGLDFEYEWWKDEAFSIASRYPHH
jgi:hypothetical protein